VELKQSGHLASVWVEDTLKVSCCFSASIS
jgi:hypothetical protein